MLHVWVIALFAGIVLRDSLGAPVLAGWLSTAQAAYATLGAMLLVGLATHLIVSVGTSRLRARGSWRAVVLAEGTLAASRWAIVIVHVVSILVLGWLDSVRALVGDVIVLDEALALMPALLVFAWGWWAGWPMERDLRQATMMRQLDEGAPVYAIPTRAEYAILNLRQQVLVWLAPLMLILAWAESTEGLTRVLADRGGATFAFLRDAGTRSMVNTCLQLLGVLAVFLVLGPLAMRLVWDTVRLAPGPLRDELLALCRRHRVRVSEVLVWRTHGTMINGAVLGLTPAFRYVLLTDALLDSLPDEQVEAVMAHEVAHVRHRHILWLGVVMLATMSYVGLGVESAASAAGWATPGAPIPSPLALGAAVASLALALLVMGVVSRRFEWQADAFAAAHMSERLAMLRAPGEAGPAIVTHDGASAMAGALRAVARLNHVPLDRRSWRHGSIGLRVARLGALVGVPAARAPINRTARMLKRLTLLAVVVLITLLVVQFMSGA